MMNAQEIYEKETGNKSPNNQIAYNEWYNDYICWLEKEVVDYHLIKKHSHIVTFKKSD